MLAYGLIWLWGLMPLHAEEKKPDLPEKGTIYSPIGKRDPYRPLGLTGPGEREVSNLSGLEKFSVEQFQLRGILRGAGKPHAMFEDPESKTYILTEGDLIGRERATISRIVNSEVILTQRTFNYLGAESLLEKVMSLPKNDDVNNTDATGLADQVRGRKRRRGGTSGGDTGGAGNGGSASAAPAGGNAISNLLPEGVQDAIKSQIPRQPSQEEIYKAATGEDLDAKTPSLPQ